MVAQIEIRLKDKDMGIELTPAAKTLIAKRGYDPTLGARPLRRALQRDIEDHLAEKILFSELKPGEIVVVDVADPGSENAFTFTGTPRVAAPGHAAGRVRRHRRRAQRGLRGSERLPPGRPAHAPTRPVGSRIPGNVRTRNFPV